MNAYAFKALFFVFVFVFEKVDPQDKIISKKTQLTYHPKRERKTWEGRVEILQKFKIF